MSADPTREIARRAHQFIAAVEAIVTDEPEFAGIKTAALFAEHGPQLAQDAAALR